MTVASPETTAPVMNLADASAHINTYMAIRVPDMPEVSPRTLAGAIRRLEVVPGPETLVTVTSAEEYARAVMRKELDAHWRFIVEEGLSATHQMQAEIYAHLQGAGVYSDDELAKRKKRLSKL